MTSGFLGGNNFTFFSNGGPTLPTGIITGNVSSPYIPYANGANTLANSGLYWDATNSRVGINNTSPAQALDVTGSIKYSVGLYTPLTTGSVPFVGASGLVSQDNSNFFWDAANVRLGVGTATPTYKIDIHGTGTVLGLNGTTTNNAYAMFQNAGAGKWRIGNTYSAGANYFSIYDNVNSLDRLTILNSGFVGIGTSSPSVLLHLNSASTPAFRLVDTTQSNGYVLKSDANGNGSWSSLSGLNIPTGTGTNGYATFWTGTNTLSGDSAFFWDNTNKRLGIGLSSPTTSLHIKSNSSPAFRLDDVTQGNGYILKSDSNGNGSWSSLSALNIPTGTGTNGYVTFWTGTNTISADSAFFWDNTNKRLGIGTATPSVALHINSASSPAFRLVDTTEAAGKYLTSDANGNASWATVTVPTVSGTAGYVARFTASTTVGNSIIRDNGSQIGIAAAPNASYTVDLAGTIRMQQSVTMVSTGAYYVGIGIAPSSNGRLNVYANSITGIYITGNTLTQKGIDMNGTVLALATSAGTSSTIQASAGSGNLNLTGLGGIIFYPDAITSASTTLSMTLASGGGGTYQSAITNVGTLTVNGNIVCGNAPFAAGTGSGWIFTVDPATGAKNNNGWALGNKTAGAVTLDTLNYVRIDIGGTPIKFLIST